jgi:hypothetical protein
MGGYRSHNNEQVAMADHERLQMQEPISSTVEIATHAKKGCMHQCTTEMIINHRSAEQMTYNEIFLDRKPEKISLNSVAAKASKLTYSSRCNNFSFNF